MIITRVWGMPNRWTFKIKPIKQLIEKYVGDGVGWADPFAGKNKYCQYRNDLNPKRKQPYCLEAGDFLDKVDQKLLGVIFDPPYSLTKIKRIYNSIGLKSKDNLTGGFPKVKDKVSEMVIRGGFVLSFGWNTMGMGKNRGFEIKEILIVSHGGNRNDTLCTVEKKLWI
jgi:hypothetical protein